MMVFDRTGHFNLPEYAELEDRDRDLAISFSARQLAYLWALRLKWQQRPLHEH